MLHPFAEIDEKTPCHMMRLAQRLLIGIMSGIVVNQVIEFRIPQRQNAMGSHKFPKIGNVFVCRVNCSEFTASIRMKAESLHIVEPAKLDAFFHPWIRRRGVEVA